jgi:hypothetical protein
MYLLLLCLLAPAMLIPEYSFFMGDILVIVFDDSVH